MNKRSIGIILGVAGFLIAVGAGIWLAFQTTQGLDTGTLLGTAVVVFIPVAALIGGGAYLYLKTEPESNQMSMVEQQRLLVDLLQQHGELSVDAAAAALKINTTEVKALVEDLINLQVFKGHVNWDAGMLYNHAASKALERGE